MSVNILATITPKAGKADRVIELLKEVSKYVEANEPKTLRYQVLTEKDKKTGAVKVVMLETYEDMAAVRTHGASAEFKAFNKKIADEGLVGEPMKLQFVTKEGGFVRSKI